ncbi:alpha/beta fold hydrolase [Massilia sp. YIM B02769]|uniref:alpha/beta hydrolase family protein n=1 Tax=Massilia sp. YIM B02769 TaxID=3050129 RepID=UPI0025B6B7C4|nr:alpha/beta hydrolase [Massilia sp. YIM B02769]MDN4058997.1 alpha/beta fold hydrolase [Massilia sp. YIM B02769]
MTTEAIRIPITAAADIGARLFAASTPRGVVLVHPATAVTQGYYEAFARYLCGLGLHVVTYDYRGTGASRPAQLRGFEVSMSDWMLEDVGAVTRWARLRFPALPLLAVGHSVGGHAIGISPDTAHLRAALLVATHAGITRTILGRAERLRVWCVMRVLAPLLCGLLGYMPGRRIGLGEDLPRGVMLEWSRWTTLPRYFFDDAALEAARRMSRVAIPLLVFGFDDDPWANPGAMDILLSGYTSAPLERRQFNARSLGLPGVGHMGFFRRRCEATLWQEAGAWLLQKLADDTDTAKANGGAA